MTNNKDENYNTLNINTKKIYYPQNQTKYINNTKKIYYPQNQTKYINNTKKIYYPQNQPKYINNTKKIYYPQNQPKYINNTKNEYKIKHNNKIIRFNKWNNNYKDTTNKTNKSYIISNKPKTVSMFSFSDFNKKRRMCKKAIDKLYNINENKRKNFIKYYKINYFFKNIEDRMLTRKAYYRLYFRRKYVKNYKTNRRTNRQKVRYRRINYKSMVKLKIKNQKSNRIKISLKLQNRIGRKVRNKLPDKLKYQRNRKISSKLFKLIVPRTKKYSSRLLNVRKRPKRLRLRLFNKFNKGLLHEKPYFRLFNKKNYCKIRKRRRFSIKDLSNLKSLKVKIGKTKRFNILKRRSIKFKRKTSEFISLYRKRKRFDKQHYFPKLSIIKTITSKRIPEYVRKINGVYYKAIVLHSKPLSKIKVYKNKKKNIISIPVLNKKNKTTFYLKTLVNKYSNLLTTKQTLINKYYNLLTKLKKINYIPHAPVTQKISALLMKYLSINTKKAKNIFKRLKRFKKHLLRKDNRIMKKTYRKKRYTKSNNKRKLFIKTKHRSKIKKYIMLYSIIPFFYYFYPLRVYHHVKEYFGLKKLLKISKMPLIFISNMIKNLRRKDRELIKDNGIKRAEHYQFERKNPFIFFKKNNKDKEYINKRRKALKEFTIKNKRLKNKIIRVNQALRKLKYNSRINIKLGKRRYQKKSYLFYRYFKKKYRIIKIKRKNVNIARRKIIRVIRRRIKSSNKIIKKRNIRINYPMKSYFRRFLLTRMVKGRRRRKRNKKFMRRFFTKKHKFFSDKMKYIRAFTRLRSSIRKYEEYIKRKSSYKGRIKYKPLSERKFQFGLVSINLKRRNMFSTIFEINRPDKKLIKKVVYKTNTGSLGYSGRKKRTRYARQAVAKAISQFLARRQISHIDIRFKIGLSRVYPHLIRTIVMNPVLVRSISITKRRSHGYTRKRKAKRK